MKPLTRWTCDSCGEDITDPNEAWVAFNANSWNGATDFEIVHHNLYGKQCDPTPKSTFHLCDALGSDGVSYLMSFLSYGPLKNPGGMVIADMDGFVDLVRRVQVPWYEEARRLWGTAWTYDRFCDANEISPYLAVSLEQIANQPTDDE